MRSRIVSREGQGFLKAAAAVLLASASAACSSDASRFGDNAFTNPFAAAATAKVDKAPTGSVAGRAAPLPPVATQALPPPLPRGAAPGLSPAPASRLASTAPQATAIEGSAAGWTAAGGTPVTVGPGETAATLSARYGVPVAAINAANAGGVRPGQQAIIPIYSGSQKTAAAPQPVARPAAQPAAPEPPASSAPPAAAAKPVAAKPAETGRRIVAAAPKGPTPAQAAAKPFKPANAAKPDDDDDDEEEAPRKIAQAAPKPVAQPQAQAPAKPAQPVQAAQPPRPQPRVIPMTPQAPKPEEPPQRMTMVAPAADATTTQSIPVKPVQQPAEEKADFRWPARGRVISGFGSRGGNGDGIAIAVPEGTPVKAASDGVVAYAGEELKGYGKLVLVRHDNGYVSAYAHNGELNVKRGEKVSRGQTIAKSGATGNVTSPQLHFELRKGSTPVDPTKYLEN
jgi:murein DD-endopeptidase MepM/ murein hydrolase activator NlpD